MAGNASTSEPKPPEMLERREISLRPSASVQNLVDDAEQNPTLETQRHRFFSSASSVVIGHNEDLLTQIFLRLPPKSLLRFQCVCKPWLSIISNYDFRLLHCEKFATGCLSSDASALFLYRILNGQKPVLNFISLSGEDGKPMGTLVSRLTDFFPSEVWGLHSCNGLLCIGFRVNSGLGEFIVYNPTTGHCRFIPQCKAAEKSYRNPCINIAFDPSKSCRYKLVCVWMEQYDRVFHFVVYCSETGEWKESGDAIEIHDEPFYFGNGVLWNGNLHWVSRWKSVLSFDLDNSRLKWSLPSLPVSLSDESDFWYFGESAGCLYAIEANLSRTLLFDVFELERRDCSKWHLKLRLDLTPLTILYPSIFAENYYPHQFRIPRFLLSKKENNAIVAISLEGKVISYDINDKSVRELIDVGLVDPCYCPKNLYNWYQAFTFTETLAYV